jgi:hypothetical protein
MECYRRDKIVDPASLVFENILTMETNLANIKDPEDPSRQGLQWRLDGLRRVSTELNDHTFQRVNTVKVQRFHANSDQYLHYVYREFLTDNMRRKIEEALRLKMEREYLIEAGFLDDSK